LIFFELRQLCLPAPALLKFITLELFYFFQLNVFFILECNFAILAFAVFALKFNFVGFQKLLLIVQFYFVAADIFYYFPKNYAVQPILAHKIFFLSHLSCFLKQCFNFSNRHFHFSIGQLNFLNQ